MQIAAAATALAIAVFPAAVDRVAPALLAALGGPAEAAHGAAVRAGLRASEVHAVVAVVVLEAVVVEGGGVE